MTAKETESHNPENQSEIAKLKEEIENSRAIIDALTKEIEQDEKLTNEELRNRVELRRKEIEKNKKRWSVLADLEAAEQKNTDEEVNQKDIYEEFRQINKDQTCHLNEINDYIKKINDEIVDLQIDDLNKTIYISHNFDEFESEEFDEFKFFKNIKPIIKKPFNIWFTSEIGDEWCINFLIFYGKTFLNYATDDINDFILTLDESSDSYDEERGDILAQIDMGYLDDDQYPKIPNSSTNIKPDEYWPLS